jgi:protein-S-isoprenylcysteine O-methyltransferase Ste14
VSDEQKDVAGVIAFPPLLFVVALGAGLVLERALPGRLRRSPASSRSLAQPLLGGSFALAAWAMIAMKRVGTPIDVQEPSTALVTSGPFRFTRNPIYLALTLAYAGLALRLRSWLSLLLLAPLLAVVQHGVIAREERYLERKFGDLYRAYVARVRRWL